jgi:radical SAM superfamily enzyme YgiQ (UPF0313 family)
LDSLPFQPWHIFAKLPYDFTCPWLKVGNVFTMNTSRGCPFNCLFCSVGSIWGRQYTCFSARRIVAEIAYLVHRFDAKGIYFREDNFTLSQKRTRAFCEELMRKKINIKWACETRVDTICDEELVKIMSRSGCGAVYLGVESGSQKVLDAWHKDITLEQVEKAVGLCKKYGLRTYFSFLVGTPYDNYADYLKTMALIKKVRPSSYFFNVFVGIPDSPLYQHIQKNRLYEFRDEAGLQYLPGFDVKSRFFHELPAGALPPYRFQQKTEFDRLLAKQYRRRKIRKLVPGLVKTVLPRPVRKRLKRWLGHEEASVDLGLQWKKISGGNF